MINSLDAVRAVDIDCDWPGCTNALKDVPYRDGDDLVDMLLSFGWWTSAEEKEGLLTFCPDKNHCRRSY